VNEDLASLQSKHVDEFVRPTGHKCIDLRWVFYYKLCPDGAVERYKARLAKGYTQEHGVDVFSVWAPAGRLAAYVCSFPMLPLMIFLSIVSTSR
jgi:hypothetical protein